MVAMEKARDMELKNVFFIDMDVAKMEEIFAPGEIDRLFINFPDPWPRKKNAKRPSDPPDISGQILSHRPGGRGRSTSKPITPPCLPTVWKNLPPAVWK